MQITTNFEGYRTVEKDLEKEVLFYFIVLSLLIFKLLGTTTPRST